MCRFDSGYFFNQCTQERGAERLKLSLMKFHQPLCFTTKGDMICNAPTPWCMWHKVQSVQDLAHCCMCLMFTVYHRTTSTLIGPSDEIHHVFQFRPGYWCWSNQYNNATSNGQIIPMLVKCRILMTFIVVTGHVQQVYATQYCIPSGVGYERHFIINFIINLTLFYWSIPSLHFRFFFFGHPKLVILPF